jgi:hypothetical protein
VLQAARLNCISHLLSQVPYKELPSEKIVLPPRYVRCGVVPDQAELPGVHVCQGNGLRGPSLLGLLA